MRALAILMMLVACSGGGSAVHPVDLLLPYANCTAVDAHDSDLDGTVDRTSDRVYDELGRLVSLDQDFDIDGVIDQRFAYTYTVEHQPETLSVFQADGALSQRTTWTYDGIHATYLEIEVDGVVDARSEFTTDEAGHIVQTDQDYEADGVTDARIEHTWEDEREVANRTDQGLDGTWDRRELRVYDADGRLVGGAFYVNDALTDQWAYTLDEEGRVVRYQGRGVDGGAWEYESITTYDCP